MPHKHRHGHRRHKLRQIKKGEGGVLSADVDSSFIDAVTLDKKAGVVTVTIDGVDYDYEGDREDFQGVRREGGSYFNDVLRPQDESGKK